MRNLKKIGVLMAVMAMTLSFATGCGSQSSKKFAKVDESERTKKLDKTLANLKNRKDIIAREKAALMTTDYEDLRRFEAITLDGKDYSQKDLEKKDMTIAYVWYPSWHGCVESMPELGQFSKKLPENIGFITICDNSKVNDKVVEKIFDKSKFHPTTLVDGDEKFQTVFDHLVYAPTILLIDKTGKVEGEMVMKGDYDKVENYTEFVKIAEELLESRKDVN